MQYLYVGRVVHLHLFGPALRSGCWIICEPEEPGKSNNRIEKCLCHPVYTKFIFHCSQEKMAKQQKAFQHINTNMQIKFSCSLNECNFHFFLFYHLRSSSYEIPVFAVHLDPSLSLSSLCFLFLSLLSVFRLLSLSLRGGYIGQIKRQMSLKRGMYVRMYSIYSFLFSHIFYLHVKNKNPVIFHITSK